MYGDSTNQWSRDYKKEELECSSKLPSKSSKYMYERDGESTNLWDEDEVYEEGV